MKKTWMATVFLFACSESDPAPAEVHPELVCDGTGALSFAEIHAQIIAPSCASCHKGGGTAPDMSTPAIAVTSIRDVVSPHHAGAGGTLKIVDPGAPENSTLMLKVLGGAPKGFAGPQGEDVGGIMPQVGTLSTAQKNVLRHWICAGANP